MSGCSCGGLNTYPYAPELHKKSALLQLVTQYSLSDNMTFLGSVNIPVGANGTEFCGPESGLPTRYRSFNLAVFAQLAWYF